MKYVLAVSGGVDSAVLLDMWAEEHAADELIVVHVDHGIRDDSAADARFVEGLAAKYGLACVTKRFDLGVGASEAVARTARYEFLFEMAREHGCAIVTAHHADDMIGSIAINLRRGTGWRGLAVLDRAGLIRPLLTMRKKDIYAYALDRHLEWVEDSTNNDIEILRNRLRPRIVQLGDKDVQYVAELRTRQIELKHAIDSEIARLIVQFGMYRYPYALIDHRIAKELLRDVVARVTGVRPMYGDAGKLAMAIKTARAGKQLQLSNGVCVRFDVTEFIVERPPR